jgi:hypothetical protein
MWIALKIGVLYGAPALAAVLAIAYFALLWVRVRRGALGCARAAALYPLALVLAPAAVALIWATAELASYFSVPAGGFVWDSGEALALLHALLPIAAYVGIPIAALVIVFWITLFARCRKSS